MGSNVRKSFGNLTKKLTNGEEREIRRKILEQDGLTIADVKEAILKNKPEPWRPTPRKRTNLYKKPRPSKTEPVDTSSQGAREKEGKGSSSRESKEFSPTSSPVAPFLKKGLFKSKSDSWDMVPPTGSLGDKVSERHNGHSQPRPDALETQAMPSGGGRNEGPSRPESEPETVHFKQDKVKSPSYLPKQMTNKIVGVRKGINRKWKEFNEPDYHDRKYVPHGMLGDSAEAEAFNNGYYKRNLDEEDQVMAKRGLKGSMSRMHSKAREKVVSMRKSVSRKWKKFNTPTPDYYSDSMYTSPHRMSGDSAEAEAFNNGYYKRSPDEEDQVMAKRGLKGSMSKMHSKAREKVVSMRKTVSRKWKKFNTDDYYESTYAPHRMSGDSAEAEAFNNGYYKRSLVEEDQVLTKRAVLKESLAKVRAVTKQVTFGSRSAAFRKAEEKERVRLEREAAYLDEKTPSASVWRPMKKHERAMQKDTEKFGRDQAFIKMQEAFEMNPERKEHYQRQYEAAHPPPSRKGFVGAMGRIWKSSSPSQYVSRKLSNSFAFA